MRDTPQPLLSFHRKGQLAGCSWGHRLYVCISKPSSDRRLHETETDSRVTNGSCAMSLKCISHDCKLDLVTIQGNITGDQYIRDVLQAVVVPHFDNHPLATRSVYMDDNPRPHLSRVVTAYLQSEAVTCVSWLAMSPILNPIEHSWDMLARRIQAREPPVQIIRQLEAAAISTGHPTYNWRDETQG
jgi:hypothetical protein